MFEVNNIKTNIVKSITWHILPEYFPHYQLHVDQHHKQVVVRPVIFALP